MKQGNPTPRESETSAAGERTSVAWASLAVVDDVLVRVIRAAEFVEDGEVEDALQVLLDLVEELRATLGQEAAA